MAGTIPVRVGDVEVLVETVPVAGSEPTSRISDAAVDSVNALTRAQDAIVEMATATASTIAAAASRGARPNRVEVEFGLQISAKGNVIIAGGSGAATLRVLLSYDATSE